MTPLPRGKERSGIYGLGWPHISRSSFLIFRAFSPLQPIEFPRNTLTTVFPFGSNPNGSVITPIDSMQRKASSAAPFEITFQSALMSLAMSLSVLIGCPLGRSVTRLTPKLRGPPFFGGSLSNDRLGWMSLLDWLLSAASTEFLKA